MKTTLDNFYKKWNGERLGDGGSSVSYGYNAFQNALNRCMKAVAKDLGAEVVHFTKGHYFETIVFHRNGHYVYLHHEDLDRTHIDLNNNRPKNKPYYTLCGGNANCSWMIRTMAHASDWRGGYNEFSFNWSNLTETIDKFLNMEHKPIF